LLFSLEAGSTGRLLPHLRRTETYHRPPDTIVVEAGAKVGYLCISDSSFVNRSERKRGFLTNEGEIAALSLSGIRCRTEGGAPRGYVLDNRGTIGYCMTADVATDN
jgi:hypothetical protein